MGAARAKPKIQITFDKYMSIQNMVVRRIRAAETVEGAGLRRGDLLEWYLGEQANHMETEEALIQEHKVTWGYIVLRLFEF